MENPYLPLILTRQPLIRVMKTFVLTACIWLQCLGVLAQGTFTFLAELHADNAIPPGASGGVEGTATFLLSDNLLHYEITTDFRAASVARIHGPALAGEIGEELYDLGLGIGVPPFPPHDPGSTLWWGDIAIQAEQIPDLMGGLWYLEVRGTYVDFASRGQIVPEPGALLLLALAAVGLIPFCRRRKLK